MKSAKKWLRPITGTLPMMIRVLATPKTAPARPPQKFSTPINTGQPGRRPPASRPQPAITTVKKTNDRRSHGLLPVASKRGPAKANPANAPANPRPLNNKIIPSPTLSRTTRYSTVKTPKLPITVI